MEPKIAVTAKIGSFPCIHARNWL